MDKKNVLKLFALFFLVVSLTSFASAAITAKINASRTDNCVAPCAIFFEGTDSLDNSGNSINSIGLVDAGITKYEWDFGAGTENDISSGGRYFEGFNAAHVYETPGTYTARLTVRDAAGNYDTRMLTPKGL